MFHVKHGLAVTTRPAPPPFPALRPDPPRPFQPPATRSARALRLFGPASVVRASAPLSLNRFGSALALRAWGPRSPGPRGGQASPESRSEHPSGSGPDLRRGQAGTTVGRPPATAREGSRDCESTPPEERRRLRPGDHHQSRFDGRRTTTYGIFHRRGVSRETFGPTGGAGGLPGRTRGGSSSEAWLERMRAPRIPSTHDSDHRGTGSRPGSVRKTPGRRLHPVAPPLCSFYSLRSSVRSWAGSSSESRLKSNSVGASRRK